MRHLVRLTHGYLTVLIILTGLFLWGCGSDRQSDAQQGTQSFVSMMSAEVSPMSSSATTTVTADMTMDWAERTFPELFPAETSERFPAIEYEGVIYNARAYVGLWETSYLGITEDRRIFGLGDFTGGLLQQFGTIDDWADQILASPSDSGSLQTDQWWHRTVNVPAGTSQLKVYLTAPRGTVELLLKHGQQPDEQMYNADGEDCYDWADPVFDGQCVIEAPAPGTWHIALWAVEDSDYTLQINLENQGETPDDPLPPAVEIFPEDIRVNVVADTQGNQAIAVNSRSGEAAYIIHDSSKTGDPTLNNLVGVVYQAASGETVAIDIDALGRPTQMKTDDAIYWYSDYTASSVLLTIESISGHILFSERITYNGNPSVQTLGTLYPSPAMSSIDRQDVGFIIGFVGTAVSVTLCVASVGAATTGIGAWVAIGCANALVAAVGTAISDSSTFPVELGYGSTAVDLVSGYATGDPKAVATGILGAVSGLLGWEVQDQGLRVGISGVLNARLPSTGQVEARIEVTSSGSKRTTTVNNDGSFSISPPIGQGSHTITIEAKGFITKRYILAVTADQITLELQPSLPGGASEIVYRQASENPNIPALIFLETDLEPAPKLSGFVVWPRWDNAYNQLTEGVNGLVSLNDSTGNRAAFHTVINTITVRDFDHWADGYFELYLPDKHKSYSLVASTTFFKPQEIQIATLNGTTIRVTTPTVNHFIGSVQDHPFSTEVTIDVPLISNYDGHWQLTLSPDIDSYTVELGVDHWFTNYCERDIWNFDVRGGAIDLRNEFSVVLEVEENGTINGGENKYIDWSGNLNTGGSYQEWDVDFFGGERRNAACYGSFTAQKLGE